MKKQLLSRAFAVFLVLCMLLPLAVVSAEAAKVKMSVDFVGGQQHSKNKGTIRFVGCLPSDAVLLAKEVGFVVEWTYKKTSEVTETRQAGTNVVFKKVNLNGISYCEDGTVFYAVPFSDLPAAETVSMKVTPYWILMGSEEMKYGTAGSYVLSNGILFSASETVKAMSYNICNGYVGGKPITKRMSEVVEQIELVRPDVLMLNEAHNFSMSASYDANLQLLSDMSRTPYAVVEFLKEECTNAILYDRSKYDLLSSEVITLTKQDDQGGAVGDEWARFAVFAKLKRKLDGKIFVAVSIHLDLKKEASPYQAAQVAAYLAENYAGIPQIVSGDFNCSSPLVDSKNGSVAVHTDGFLHNGFSDANIRHTTAATYPEHNTVIDYIYVKGLTSSRYTTVGTDTSSKASDHLAIYAELTFNK